jgi:2-oxoglutarate dehydrogenase E1 component
MADDGRSLPNAALLETSFLSGANALFVEEMHRRYVDDPGSVDPSWRAFFDELRDNPDNVRANADGPSWYRPDLAFPRATEATALLDGNWAALTDTFEKKLQARLPRATIQDVQAAARDSVRALMMIRAYRTRGHLAANLDPLGMAEAVSHQELEPASYGFTAADWDRPIFIDGVLGLESASVRQMLDILKRTYCSTVGVEFMHITDPAEKSWLQERIEGPDKEIAFTPEGKKAIVRKLIEGETFERFLHKRYPGTKRFGLDGGEAMLPALEQVIKRGGALGVEEIVFGMAHRGRLNVLAAVMGKPYQVIFHEFQGGSATPEDVMGSGDVKYHLGASSDRAFDGNKVHLSLTANPSHLEIVNPVVLGRVRAKQAALQKHEPGEDLQLLRSRVMPLLIHGDAAFAGQGVVAECFALSGLKGYRTGGTIHFIVNNQIGFTTSPRYSRSSPYPSDVALMVQAPIFHVNGDDPEAVVFAAKVATEYRQKFGKDVVIDMFCYRRFGHNEGDDPSFTQPLMYKRISGQPSTREIYTRRLIAEGVITEADLQAWIAEFERFLDDEFNAGKAYRPNKADWLDGVWTGMSTAPDGEERRGDTDVALDKLKALGRSITHIPEGVDIHRTLKRVIEARAKAIEAGEGIDWALAEHLAFASLLDEGHAVRLSGQDSCRGTFSQRHSHFVDQTTEQRYTPLNALGAGQAHYEVIDSLLSEEAVLGFEYGYTLAAPKTLTLWEAQFGDFVNGAQVVIDQFISSGERKWLRMSGLVMLLPHGYEGQGPEHSSARLERFLQACAEDNMQVVNCTTPANYFHVLRRQLHRSFRKPLVIMTPKSLLRHKKCVSTLAEMAEGSSFHRVLWDDAQMGNGLTTVTLKPDEQIRRVILCSGKVYFDLLDEREKRGIDDVYILRLEQFYPWPLKSLTNELKRFPGAELVWCQEEPKNMGGWTFVDPWIELTLDKMEIAAKRARYVGRPASASTAAGLMSKHNRELEAFLADAFAPAT